MRSTFFTIFGLLATSTLGMAEAPVHEALKGLTRDPQGFVHIADDGVARSYNSNREVIAYVGLSNSQLMEYISALPGSHNYTHLHEVFDKVNGLDVTDKQQLTSPPASLAPAKAAGTKTTNAFPSRVFPRQERPSTCEEETCTTQQGCIDAEDLNCSGCNFLDAELSGNCVTA